jgi:hypothetical protein
MKGDKMNRNSVVFLVVAAIFLGLIAGGVVVRGSEPKRGVLWEYKTLQVGGAFTDAERTLNEYGKKG